ncbi:MAG: pyruvate dehydrogenase complex E1 component subunit beta [Deltaproteobacteria bacterium]|nr:MAG: pyruvate dehydrogenase complex E1 component subunit beta [Deltaproteobacteria bacterium]
MPTTWLARATPGRRWPSSTAARPERTGDGAGRCTSSTRPSGSSAGGPSSAATCRSPPGWPSRASTARSATSRSASSATAPRTWGRSTRGSRSRGSGSCPSSSSARTTSTPWARRSTAPCPSPTSRSGRAATRWSSRSSTATTCSRCATPRAAPWSGRARRASRSSSRPRRTASAATRWPIPASTAPRRRCRSGWSGTRSTSSASASRRSASRARSSSGGSTTRRRRRWPTRSSSPSSRRSRSRSPSASTSMPEPRVITFREALREAMAEEMERDPSIFLMGEEVGHYQGAYKVSEGLLARFGEKRVIDTPIAETGFAGVGIGAAMVGLRPIIEFMTWNFSLTAYDQLVNNAAKLRYMANGQFTLPIVFRGPGGAAHALAAQHSQALESLYAHVPGLKVVMPATPADAKGLLKAAIRDDDPVVFIESEVMYALKGEVPAGEHLVPLGVADVKRRGRDVTIVTWAKMLHTSLKAAEELAQAGIEAEVVDLRTIRPLDTEAIFASVRRTGRCLVVQEGWPFAGVASEIITLVVREAFDDLDAPPERVTSLDVPMPYATNLEALVLPSPDRVVAAVRRLLGREQSPARPAAAGGAR